jgi:hypothetical protein
MGWFSGKEEHLSGIISDIRVICGIRSGSDCTMSLKAIMLFQPPVARLAERRPAPRRGLSGRSKLFVDAFWLGCFWRWLKAMPWADGGFSGESRGKEGIGLGRRGHIGRIGVMGLIGLGTYRTRGTRIVVIGGWSHSGCCNV